MSQTTVEFGQLDYAMIRLRCDERWRVEGGVRDMREKVAK